jgi:hypothetical protein
MFVKVMISMKMFELLCYKLEHCCSLLKLYFACQNYKCFVRGKRNLWEICVWWQVTLVFFHVRTILEIVGTLMQLIGTLLLVVGVLNIFWKVRGLWKVCVWWEYLWKIWIFLIVVLCIIVSWGTIASCQNSVVDYFIIGHCCPNFQKSNILYHGF